MTGRKSFIRWALEGHNSSAIRTAITGREILREQKFVENVSFSTGFEALNLDKFSIEVNPGRGDFFVLGSGASIENLNNQAFQEIRRATSVGINAWVLHSFVPDIYAYEPVGDPDSDHFTTMVLLDRREVLDRAPSVLFLRPRNAIEASQLDQIPLKLQKRTFLYGRVSPYTRIARNLGLDLSKTMKLMQHNRGAFVAMDSGATIVRMTSLALLLGFQRIIYVGVDLTHTDYFWQVNPQHLQGHGLSSFDSEQKWEVHETEMPGFAPFTASTFIAALAPVAKRMYGTELLVASEQSKLAEFLPVFSFKGRSFG